MKYLSMFLAVLMVSCATPRAVSLPNFTASTEVKYKNVVDLGAIRDMEMAEFQANFMSLVAKGEKEITVRIDSFGGSIFLGRKVGRDIEDLKKLNGVRVTCIVDGAAYSMGAILLQSRMCDIRLATERATILFHNGSGAAQGTAEDMKNSAAQLEAVNISMATQCCLRMGMKIEEFRAKIAHSDWMMATPEALYFNVIDGTVDSASIAAPFQG